jgi:hypothetical protein
MKRGLVIDFLSVFPNLKEAYANALRFHLGSGIWEKYESVLVVANGEDKALVEAIGPEVRAVQSPPGIDAESAVYWATVNLSNGQQFDEIHVRSHKTPVLRKVLSLENTHRVRVRTFNLSEIAPAKREPTSALTAPLPAGFGYDRPRAPRPEGLRGWQWDHIVSETEALGQLQKVLEQRGAYDPRFHIRQTDVKPLIQQFDHRWCTGRGTTAGMVGTLVQLAEQKGLVQVSREGVAFNNPVIWLKKPNPGAVAAPVAAVPPPEAVVAPPHEADPPSDGPSGGAAEHEPKQSQHPGADRPAAVPRTPTRRDKMQKHIESRRMGPYTTLRLPLFQALSEVLDPENPETLRALLSRAAANAGPIVDAHFQDDAKPSEPRARPWKEVIRLLSSLLPAAGVAIDADGQPVPPGVKGVTVKVTRLVDGWECRVDAEIVCKYLESAGALPFDELEELGGVMYNKFLTPDAARARVAEILTLLMKDGRVLEEPDPDGFGISYRLRPHAVANGEGVEHAPGSNGVGTNRLALV